MPSSVDVLSGLNSDYCINLRNGAFAGTSREDLDALFTSFRTARDNQHMVVHFHGGMARKQSGIELADRLLPVYRHAKAFPVFFVCESGLTEVIHRNLPQIFNELIFQQILRRVTQFAIAKLDQTDGSRSMQLELPGEFEIETELDSGKTGLEPFWDIAINLPPDERLRWEEEEQFWDALENDAIIQEEATAIEAWIAPPRGRFGRGRGAAAKRTLMSPEVLEDMRERAGEDERGILGGVLERIIQGSAMVLGRVIKRFAQKRDHGVYKTIVEEILREFYLASAGQLVWKHMKRATDEAFGGDPMVHGGTAFLEGLNTVFIRGRRPRVTLIGHGTGAVYICRFLKHADAMLPPDVKFDIIFLAAGVDFELLGQTLDLYGHRIDHIRTFGMSDEGEAGDALIKKLPHVYPGSLLYFISGVLEKEADWPLVGMQRYFSSKDPYTGWRFKHVRSVTSYLDRRKQSRIWAQCGDGDGFNCDNDPETLARIQHILLNGY